MWGSGHISASGRASGPIATSGPIPREEHPEARFQHHRNLHHRSDQQSEEFPMSLKGELRQATNQAISILQDNYLEFVARQVFVNVPLPWWYLAFNKMISPFLTPRTKSKFVFAGPSKSAETLFKYITQGLELVPRRNRAKFNQRTDNIL
ncbi:unnamed protein product [Linum trigynum]|uniref:CRAL-TRIO domain-containing protein n=1 Tax=Linum trigynum TaxID=586398 RepID=A0AAV2F874_9ROSI